MTKEELNECYECTLKQAEVLFSEKIKSVRQIDACKLIYKGLLKNLTFSGVDAKAEKTFAYKIANEVVGIPESNHSALAWKAMSEFLVEEGISQNAKKPRKTHFAKTSAQVHKQQVQQIEPQAKSEEITHAKFGDMMNIIRNRAAHGQSLYLYGPAGTGKSHIAEQLANHLGLKYRVMNSCRDVYDLKGFRNASGEFMQTDFYDCFVNGGVFCLDEVDNSDAQSLTCINGALANKQLMFGDGKLHKQHDDFVFIACANTVGRGGDSDYIRDVLDKSTLDRFVFIETDYDKRIELLLAKNASNPKQLVSFIDGLRKSAEACSIELLVTYRAVKTIAALEKVMPLAQAVSYGINRGLSTEDLRQLVAHCECESENIYLQALKSTCE